MSPNRENLLLDESPLTLAQLRRFVFQPEGAPQPELDIAQGSLERVQASHLRLLALLEKRLPIYGVTTGYGHSCFRTVQREQSEELQRNLVAYLTCGTGELLPESASRATFLIRLKSLSRGYSGVSPALLERMRVFIERGFTPAIPREGSLGASGDLVPLAYIARVLQGEGQLHAPGGRFREASEALAAAGIQPYTLKPKEGLALVNGTSAMAGFALVNLQHARALLDLLVTASAWFCIAIRGKTEAFGELVNDTAKSHPGQSAVAARIRATLTAEGYVAKRGQAVSIGADRQTQGEVQDRYSLRCVPQILGPVLETIEQAESWLETEVNGVSDNPLIDPNAPEDSSLEMGGNFYGGYLSHGMDYLKISLAHMADLLDRQLTVLVDDKSSRGLPPNLADWGSIPEHERFLHHGLKGLHQSVNAITSEILAKSMPNGVFSRSSESHNQDKVSLGMSAAAQCSEMIEKMYNIQAMHLACLAQALDLRGVRPRDPDGDALYGLVRRHFPFVSRDRALGEPIISLSRALRDRSLSNPTPWS